MDSQSLEQSARKGLQMLRGKEGIVKIIYVLAGLALVTVGGIYLAPYLILALENWLLLAGLAVVAFAVAYVLFSPTFQNAAVYFLDNIILRIHNAVIQSDPFSTAQNAIKKLKRRRDEMRGYVEQLRGSRRQLEQEIGSFSKERDSALRTAKAARDQGNLVQESRYANTASRLRESIERLQPVLERTETLNGFLEKMFQLLDAKIGESEDSLKIALREHQIMETSANAVREAQKAMSGPDQEMFEESMRAISDRTFAMVGEVEMFMDITKPLLDGRDFESQAKAMAALEEFQQWAGQDSELMPKEAKRQLLIEAGHTTFLPAETQAVKSGDKYGLINRKR